MTYEERLDAIAEEKNEQKQIEKHFEDLNREMLEQQLSDALTRIEDIKANCDFALEGKDVEIMELKKQIEKMKEVIAELIAITDKEICKECDCGIHCSECNVNHAQTYANYFLNGELEE